MTKTFEIHDMATGNTLQLQCEMLLREVPGRRQVWRGTCNGQSAIIKIFQLPLHKRRHLMREYQGFKELSERGLPTANVLAAGKDLANQEVLVLENIDNAEDVLTLSKSPSNSSESDFVLKKLMQYLAKMHQQGIMQHDLHLGNFLWDGQTIYGLDPAQMMFHSKPISENICIKQLGILFSVCHWTLWQKMDNLIAVYYQAKNINIDSFPINSIRKIALRRRQKIIHRFLRKTLRTSTHYIKTVDKKNLGVFSRKLFGDQNTQLLMQQLDELMQFGQILKDGNTCFVSKIEICGTPVVAKRYNFKGWWHAFRHTLKRSRARRCWLFGNRLKVLNVSSAEPLAYIEQRHCGIIRQSYILNEYIAGPQLYNFVNDEKYKNFDQETIIQKTENLLHKLIDVRLTHGDMKPNNVLVFKEEPVLIDLDSMKYHRLKWTLNYYGKKMLTQFRNRLFIKKD